MSFRSLAAAPDGHRLYVVDNTERVHALAIDGTRTELLGWNLSGRAWSLALSPDGKTLAIADRSGMVALVDTAQGTVRTRLRPPDSESEGRTRAIAFAPSGRELAIGTQLGNVEIWSVDDPSAPRIRLPGHRGPVTTLAYDPEEHYLASGGSDKLVQIWDLVRVRDEIGRVGLAW
jgi:WD40 repeat protein